MPFKIDTSYKKWAENILTEGKHTKKENRARVSINNSDFFYIFFMVGVAFGKTSKLASDNTDVGSGKNYSQPYVNYKDLLATILILSESTLSGFKTESQIKGVLESYIDTDNETHLTTKAENLMNTYVQSGFEYLKAKLNKPIDANNFLLDTYKEIEKLFDKNEDWK